jgi:voltage-gated potassium channel Kch
VIERLIASHTPYVVLERDPGRAGQLLGEGISVLAGESGNRVTYERAAASRARMVIATGTS